MGTLVEEIWSSKRFFFFFHFKQRWTIHLSQLPDLACCFGSCRVTLALSMPASPCSSAYSFDFKWLDTVCGIQWRIQCPDCHPNNSYHYILRSIYQIVLTVCIWVGQRPRITFSCLQLSISAKWTPVTYSVSSCTDGISSLEKYQYDMYPGQPFSMWIYLAYIAGVLFF